MNRRLLLTGAEHLSVKQWRRLQATLDGCDPTNEIGAAWGVKERLRLLLAESEPSRIRWRLADFYDAALGANMAETTRLAKTIQTCARCGPGPPREHKGRPGTGRRRVRTGSAGANLDLRDLPGSVQLIVRAAYGDSFGTLFLIAAVVSVVTLVSILLVREVPLRDTVELRPGRADESSTS